MKAKWNELRGTGTYEAWAKSYLEEKGYTLKSDYSLFYASDPTTWDVFATYWSTDSSAIVNTYDGLYEYDCEGYIQPALATSFEVSDDGCTYTFHLREGVKWVDFQGRELADVQADDFVAGMQHLLDAQAGMEYLAGAYGGCNIVNADAYMTGEVTDFAEVGVKAVDKYTVEYTLAAPCPCFETMLGYTTFAPCAAAIIRPWAVSSAWSTILPRRTTPTARTRPPSPTADRTWSPAQRKATPSCSRQTRAIGTPTTSTSRRSCGCSTTVPM